jgi:hypothetical protein
MRVASYGTMLCILMAGGAVMSAAGQLPGSGSTIVVPEGTEFKLKLQTPVDSKTSKVGDHLAAILISPAYVDNTIALPTGTRLEGTVMSVKHAARRGRGGIITPVFNFAELADGRKIPILGMLTEVYPGERSDNVRVDLEGDLKGRGPSPWIRTALVAGVAAGGGVGGIGIGVAAGIGGLFGAIFLPRGHEAALEAGSMIGVRLVKNAQVPFPQQQPVASKFKPRASYRPLCISCSRPERSGMTTVRLWILRKPSA